MRTAISFSIPNITTFKESLLRWAQQFEEVVWLDSNGHQGNYNSFDALLAVDAVAIIKTETQGAFACLFDFRNTTRDWIFGFLTYDLKNDVEILSSKNHDELQFPDLFFFQPKRIIKIQGSKAHFMYFNSDSSEMKTDFETICALQNHKAIPDSEIKERIPIRIKMRIFKDEYFKRVTKILAHIHRGDVYEVNFCQEFYAEDTRINPLKVYSNLNRISRAPFATYLKLKDNYLLSASPERYLKKTGRKLISQPIKGTTKRDVNKAKDDINKRVLEKDEKERSENIMIVDLVRNDLSKSAIKGSVYVEELCKVYTFKQVHHMISTITAQIPEGRDPVEILKETFPMGSMTGAPKIEAMKIIEELESFKRGLYSGAVGYFTPEGDFDFNVIIRSILYNADTKYVSFSVGSAITAKAVAEREYEECLLKAKAMRSVLENTF